MKQSRTAVMTHIYLANAFVQLYEASDNKFDY